MDGIPVYALCSSCMLSESVAKFAACHAAASEQLQMELLHSMG